jgi:hypothetical protein
MIRNLLPLLKIILKKTNKTKLKFYFIFIFNYFFGQFLKNFFISIKLTLKYQNEKPYSLKSMKVKVSQMENYYNDQSKNTEELSLKTDLHGSIEFNLTVHANISAIYLQVNKNLSNLNKLIIKLYFILKNLDFTN